MELEKFDTVFHVALGLNFAYAIESFSKRISLFFSEPARFLALKFKSKFSDSIVGINETRKAHPKLLGTKADNFQNFYTKKFSWIQALMTPDTEEIAEKKFNFDSKFQSIYLACGVLSIAMIILIPFSEGLEMDKDRLMVALFSVDCLILGVIFYCFATSFSPAMPRVPNFAMVVILLCLIALFFGIYFKVKTCNVFEFMKDDNCVISFTVTLALLVFILHILRVALLLLSLCIILGWGIIRYGKINKRFANKAKSAMDLSTLQQDVEVNNTKA
jgi:hypothetical protein